MIGEDVGALIERGGRRPCFDQTGTREFEDEGRGVVLGRKRGELQNAGVKGRPAR
jgi:hypothetical protein